MTPSEGTVGLRASRVLPSSPTTMKHLAIALVALSAAACHAEGRPPSTATAIPEQPPPSASPWAPPAAPVDAAPPPSAPALPPPKPTTISLAKTGDPALDAALADADAAFERGELDVALAAYEAAKKGAPRRAAPIVGLARVAITRASPSLGFAAAEGSAEIAAAAKELKRATELEPKFGPALVELGRAYLLLGDVARAEAALQRGVPLCPGEPEAHSAFGVALLAAGKGDEALGELTKAKELDPGSAARRGNLGTVLFMRGRVAEAIREYEAQALLVPDDARARSDLGTALLAENDLPRAIAELRRAVALDPTRATFRSNLGYALQLQGSVRDAIAEYREALRLDPKLASAWINLATALARDPSTRGQAREALERAKALDPTDPRVKANLEELDALERSGPSAPAVGSSPSRSTPPRPSERTSAPP